MARIDDLPARRILWPQAMKTKIVLIFLVVAALVVGIVLATRRPSHPPVTVTLRIAVNPVERSAYVVGEANSAKFKYLMGKQSGVKPALAQKLSVKAVPNSSVLEARIAVLSKDEGQRYVAGFIDTLQGLCGNQVQLALAEQAVR
jgi:hypothetical protein